MLPPRHAGGNKHSAKTSFFAESLSFSGIFHHPNFGPMFSKSTGLVQSPPVGQDSHVHSGGSGEVLLRYSVSLQVSFVFQLRLMHDGEPSFGCFHPSGQYLHVVLGKVF